MEDSILISTKQMLGIDESDTSFDLDILTHINTAFATLNQLGIGPADGFEIEDDTALWSTYIESPKFNAIKTYVYLRVRMLFDPPTTSYLIEAQKQQREEFEMRLSYLREELIWVEPTTTSATDCWDVWA